MKKPNYFQTTRNNLGMLLVEFNTLKKYCTGIDSIKWAYKEYLRGVNINSLFREQKYQEIHHKIIQKGDSLVFKKNLPREPILEETNPQPKSIIFNEKKYSNKHFWEQLVNNSDKLLNKGYIINLYSQIGEQGLLAGSVLLNSINEKIKNKNTKTKITITTGAKLDYDFKDFNDYDSSVSKMAKVDCLGIFSYNTLSSSDFNKAKFEALLDECFVNKTLVILTSKKEVTIKGREIINIGFTDKVKKETDLLKDILG